MFEIRASAPEDRPKIHEVRKSAWKKSYAGILPQEVIDEATADARLKQPAGMRGGLLVPESILSSRIEFVAIAGEQILGFVAGGKPRETLVEADCELWAIYVAPDTQGKGIGKQLFETFCAAMKRKNFRKLVLWALKENTSARRFYEQLGGHLEETQKPFRWNGKSIAQEVAYTWNLKDQR